MVVHTRLDCVLGSAALMRRAVAEATHHAAHRVAFGRLGSSSSRCTLNVLADLCLDSEAATATALRLARAVDEGDHAFQRLATTVAKYRVCKTTPPLVAEALECIGGNGYVEESALPRLFRESPLNSLWEGAGNVNALDLWRAAAREPESVEALLARDRARGGRGRAARRGDASAFVRELARRRGGASTALAASPSSPRSACRARCSCGMRRPRSRTRSAPPGSAVRAGALRHAPARSRLRRDRRAPPASPLGDG